MQLDPPSAVRHSEVVREGLVIVQEILANEVAPITEAEDKFLMAEMSVIAHQVPDNGPDADVHQGLRNGVRVLTQPRPKTATEQYYFHSSNPIS